MGKVAIAAFIVFSTVTIAQGEIYKHVDENGNITFSDRKLTSDSDAVSTFDSDGGTIDAQKVHKDFIKSTKKPGLTKIEKLKKDLQAVLVSNSYVDGWLNELEEGSVIHLKNGESWQVSAYFYWIGYRKDAKVKVFTYPNYGHLCKMRIVGVPSSFFVQRIK